MMLIPFIERLKTFQGFGHQQGTPAFAVALGGAVNDLGYRDTGLECSEQSVAFTQYRRPPPRVKQAAVGVPGLLFGVKRLTQLGEALNTAITTATLVRLFDPFALGLPPAVKAGVASEAGGVTECYGHGLPSCCEQGRARVLPVMLLVLFGGVSHA